MSDLVIYTKVGCPYCAAAKKHYTEQGREYEEIDVHKTTGAIDKIKEITEGKTIVPVIVDNGEVTVGFGGG